MSLSLFNPLHIPKVATPEGHTGPHARLFLPFYQYGYWFANGQQLSFIHAELPQRSSRLLNGLTRPDTFRKDASSCPVAASHV